jgi:hypothetical protein
VSPDETGIDPEYIDPEYPYLSQGFMLYIGYEFEEDPWAVVPQDLKINCFAIPEFNQPEVKFVEPDELIYEFFFYHDTSVIIFVY